MISLGKEKYSWKTSAIWGGGFALLSLPGLLPPLHGDEAKTYLEHVDSAPFQLLLQYTGPNQHSLFSILSNASMRIFGENEVAFRLPVFFAAVLSVFFVHRLGRRLWNNRVATFASFLIVGSTPHLYWAHHGRGYALTELLALTTVCGTIFLLDEKYSKKGAWALIISGFALCVTLPSNAYFLPACGLAFIYHLWTSKKSKTIFPWYDLGKKLLPFIFLAALIAGYFLIIYDGLILGIETYKSYLKEFKKIDSLTGMFPQLLDVARNLAQPWGLWFYLPVILGVWALNKTQRGFFLILVITPIFLAVLSEMLGPPRAYVYVLPFYILLAAVGIDRGVELLSHLIPHYFHKVLPAILGLLLLIPSIYSYGQNYTNIGGIKYATMAESREALIYIKSETTKYNLLVIPFDDMALRRSLEPLVAKKMLDIFRDGQLDGITYLGHRDTPVDRIASIAGSKTFPLPASLMRGIADIGKVRIYNMKIKVDPLFYQEADTKVFKEWRKVKKPNISLTETHEHKFLGHQSLLIHKTIEKDTVIYSPLAHQINSPSGSFILYADTGKYQQKSQAAIYPINKNVHRTYLNNFFGIYREEGETLSWERINPFWMFQQSKHKGFFKWQINLTLIKLDTDLNTIREAFVLREPISYFDGIHGYLLTPMSELN
jgi:hypothetical protein